MKAVTIKNRKNVLMINETIMRIIKHVETKQPVVYGTKNGEK